MKITCLLTAACLLIGACAPAGSKLDSASPKDSASLPGTQTGPTGTLKVAWPFEPGNLHPKFWQGTGNVAGDITWVFNSALGYLDFNGEPHPMLAREIPSQERGDWVVNTDGTMVTTFHLRENTRWHDGAPLTAHDFAWAFPLYLDADLPSTDRAPENLMAGVEATDDYTLVVRWKSPYLGANVLHYRQLPPLPRHLLEEKYRTNKAAFIDGDEWSLRYVGTGPFSIDRWEPGSSVIARAHMGWALGPPKLAAIEIRFISDPNAELANLLSGEVDLINAPGVSVPEAIVARDQWVSRGEGYLKTWVIRLHYAEFQHADLPNRQRAVAELPVRQGMLHALDRQGMADATYLGLSGVADGYVLPNDPIFPDVDRVLTKYPYDPGRAAALLADGSWRRAGAGSALTNASGQTLDIETWATGSSELQAAIATDNWKSIGINSSYYILPLSQSQNAALFPAVSMNGRSIDIDGFPMISYNRPTAENRFSGTNRGSFSDPEVDRDHEIIRTSLDPRQREQATLALHKRISEVAGYGPLFYRVEVLLAKNKVRGPIGNYVSQNGITWNVHEWEIAG